MTLRRILLKEADLVDRGRWGGDFEREYIDKLRREGTWAAVNREYGISDQLGLYLVHRLVRRFRAIRQFDAGIAVIDAHTDKLRMVISSQQIESTRLWLSGMRQVDIAGEQKVTQAAVSYQLRMAFDAVNRCFKRLDDAKWLSPLILALRIKRRMNNSVSFQDKPEKWRKKVGWGARKVGA